MRRPLDLSKSGVFILRCLDSVDTSLCLSIPEFQDTSSQGASCEDARVFGTVSYTFDAHTGPTFVIGHLFARHDFLNISAERYVAFQNICTIFAVKNIDVGVTSKCEFVHLGRVAHDLARQARTS